MLKGGLKSLPQIDYPDNAKKVAAQGKVLIKVIVTQSGNSIDHEVVRGIHPELNRAALNAAQKARFIPAKIDGQPVRSSFVIPFKFHLD